MGKKFVFAAIFIVAFAFVMVADFREREAEAAPAATPNLASGLAGFDVNEIRFDESVDGKRPTPVLPADWKFISVSNGDAPNSNNLWFQDRDGNIYVVNGFTTGRRFIVSQTIGKLSVGK